MANRTENNNILYAYEDGRNVLHIAFDEELVADYADGADINPIVELINGLDMLDIYPVGSESSWGNWDMAMTLYCLNTDVVYTVLFSEVDTALETGEEFKLYPQEPDEWDREIIDSTFGDR